MLSTARFMMALCACLIGTPFAARFAGAADASSVRPNILFVFLDDYGWRDCGFMGSDFYETPNIDRLAAEGMVFENAYSCAANCAPARACLLSGQYTPRHKIYNVGTKPRGKAKHRRLEHIAGVDTLAPEIETWAARLQSAGYTTGLFGKWHLSNDPLPYGFDRNVGGTHSGSPPRGYYPPHPVPGLQDAPEDEYLTDRLSEETIKFLTQHRSDPWAIYLTHFAVHTPLQAKRELVDKYQSKPAGTLHNHVAMATMIEAVDQGVGRIMRALEETGQAENTVILFFSDNGGYGPATDMAPLKGYKGTYYEGGIRVPFFVRWPGKIAAGSRSNEPVIGVDLYPTLCEIAQAGLPSDQAVDGVSLLPLLKGEIDALAQRALYWHFPAYLDSYQRFDEQRDVLFRSRPCSVIRQGRWKLLQHFEDDAVELFDLESDIGEATNVAKRYPEHADELLKKLKTWQEGIQADIPRAANPLFDAEEHGSALAKRQAKLAGGT
ncbi:MAG: sulfatase [Planctomycetota bacterium]